MPEEQQTPTDCGECGNRACVYWINTKRNAGTHCHACFTVTVFSTPTHLVRGRRA